MVRAGGDHDGLEVRLGEGVLGDDGRNPEALLVIAVVLPEADGRVRAHTFPGAGEAFRGLHLLPR